MLGHLQSFLVPQPGHGLVEQHDRGVAGHGQRELEQALLAMTQALDQRPCPAVHAHAAQQFMRARLQRGVALDRAPEAEGVPVLGQDRQHGVLQHGHAPGQRRDLEGPRDAPAGPLRRRQARDVLIVKKDAPAVRPQGPEQLADQRRLARPVGADQGMDLALADVQRHVPGGDDATEGLEQPVHGQHRCDGGAHAEPPLVPSSRLASPRRPPLTATIRKAPNQNSQ